MNRLMIVSVGLMLMGAVPVHAHMDEDVAPSQMVDAHLKHLTKKLDLNADQQQQVKTILDQEATDLTPLHDQMKSIHDQANGKIRGVLLPEQQKKFDDMQAKKMDKMQKKQEKMAK